MTPAQAESMVRWYLNESEGDACGLQATAWTHTEEVQVGGTGARSEAGGRPAHQHGSRTPDAIHVGAQSRSYHAVDVYPDSRSWARTQLRNAHQAWCALPSWAQATLEARFAYDGGRRITVRGCSPVGRVVELIRGVRERARRDMVTPRQAAEAQFSDDGDTARDAAILRAEEAVTRAVALFREAWGRGRTERLDQFRRRIQGVA